MGAPPQPSTLARPPGVSGVLKQLYLDLFGKDVQETPTVSYVWTADQFGHIGLGFIVTSVLFRLASLSPGISSQEWSPGSVLLGCAVLNMLVWVVKELFDYARERARYATTCRQFAFNGSEILWNVVTALCFFATGSAAAAVMAPQPSWAWGILVVLVLGAGPVAYWWLRRKIAFQQAGLPYLYRLASFHNPVQAEPPGPDPAVVLVDYNQPVKVAADPNPRHLVLTGPARSGKSSLAAGIGTEFAFRLGIGRYVTLAKLLELAEGLPAPASRGGRLTDPLSQEFNDGRILWQWDKVQLLVIDDVEDVVELDTDAENAAGRAVLDDRFVALVQRMRDIARVVWVVSDRVGGAGFAELLHGALAGHGAQAGGVAMLRIAR